MFNGQGNQNIVQIFSRVIVRTGQIRFGIGEGYNAFIIDRIKAVKLLIFGVLDFKILETAQGTLETIDLKFISIESVRIKVGCRAFHFGILLIQRDGDMVFSAVQENIRIVAFLRRTGEGGQRFPDVSLRIGVVNTVGNGLIINTAKIITEISFIRKRLGTTSG